MPKINLKFTETTLPPEFKDLADANFNVSVWVNKDGDTALAGELNPTLENHKNTILAEKQSFEDRYKHLVSISSADDKKKAEEIARLERQARETAPKLTDLQQKVIDAVSKLKDATPEYVEKALNEYSKVSAELENIKKTSDIAKFFKTTGFENEKAFIKALSDESANPKLAKYYTKQEKDTKGNMIDKPYFQIKDEKGNHSEVDLETYLKDHADWSEYNLGQKTQPWIQMPNPKIPKQNVLTNPTGLPTNNFLEAMQKGQQVLQQAGQPKEKE